MSLMPRSRLIIDSPRSPSGRGHHDGQAEQQALPPLAAEQQRQGDRAADRAEQSGAGEALPGLLRADRRRHRVLAEQHAGRVAADVAAATVSTMKTTTRSGPSSGRQHEHRRSRPGTARRARRRRPADDVPDVARRARPASRQTASSRRRSARAPRPGPSLPPAYAATTIATARHGQRDQRHPDPVGRRTRCASSQTASTIAAATTHDEGELPGEEGDERPGRRGRHRPRSRPAGCGRPGSAARAAAPVAWDRLERRAAVLLVCGHGAASRVLRPRGARLPCA